MVRDKRDCFACSSHGLTTRVPHSAPGVAQDRLPFTTTARVFQTSGHALRPSLKGEMIENGLKRFRSHASHPKHDCYDPVTTTRPWLDVLGGTRVWDHEVAPGCKSSSA